MARLPGWHQIIVLNVLAATVGIVLYLVNQVTGHLGLLFDLHPALTTLVPAMVILGISLWLLRRLR